MPKSADWKGRNWPGEWIQPYRPALPVDLTTTRDHDGVTYSVSVRAVKEDGHVWATIGVFYAPVKFGQTRATAPGGAAFRRAAREQQRLADAWAEAILALEAENRPRVPAALPEGPRRRTTKRARPATLSRRRRGPPRGSGPSGP